MKGQLIQVRILVSAAVLMLACLAGCKTPESQGISSEEGHGTGRKGSVLMVGSTSMDKLANALAESFMAENPGVVVSTEFVGSGAGVEAAISGSAQIGNSSRELTEEEKSKGVIENIVAIDGLAVITDRNNTVKDLTKEQLTDIYTGKIRNWKELGGADLPVVVVGREAGSGSRSAFEEILGIKDIAVYANEIDSTGAVVAKASSIPGAIGYVSLDVVNDMVTLMKLDGVEASEETIKSGDYFLSRPFVMATKGEITEQSEEVQALFAYIYSEKGKELIKAVGLIPAE